MVIQTRCETNVSIHINDPEIELKEILIHAQPIPDNINCDNILNCIKNQQLLINVINTSDNPYKLEVPSSNKLTYEIINEVSIKYVSESNQVISNSSNCIEKLSEAV